MEAHSSNEKHFLYLDLALEASPAPSAKSRAPLVKKQEHPIFQIFRFFSGLMLGGEG